MNNQNQYGNEQSESSPIIPFLRYKFLQVSGLKSLLLNMFLFRPPNQSYTYITQYDQLIMVQNDRQQTPFTVENNILAKFKIIQSQKLLIPLFHLTLNKGKVVKPYEEQEEQKEQNDLISKNKRRSIVIIYSHGNSCDLSSVFYMGQKIVELFDVDFISYDYTGYGIGKGKFTPSESSVYQDLEQIIQYCCSELNYNINQILLFGFSLGTAVSIDIAKKYKNIGGLILLAPMTSINGLLVNNVNIGIDNDLFVSKDKITQIHSPIIIFHGDKDSIVPISHGIQLHHLRTKKNLNSQLIKIGNCGHNDLLRSVFGSQKFLVNIYDFIVDIEIEGPDQQFDDLEKNYMGEC